MEKLLQKKIQQIKDQSSFLQEKSFEDLFDLRNKYLKTSSTLTEIEWFAFVQEMSSRVIGLRHFETQLLAGLLMSQGKIVEMKTGEGKTLASTLPLSYKALSKKGAHLITVNEYLAERDQKTMGKLYKYLGLSSGIILSKNSVIQKRENYLADITYVTNTEIVFDYLRDCTSTTASNLVLRPFFYSLVDEIDSILIDEARTPFILSDVVSENSENSSNLVTNEEVLLKAKQIATSLIKEEDFVISKKIQEISLTEKGYSKCQNFLSREKLSLKNFAIEFSSTDIKYEIFQSLVNSILNALSAIYSYERNRDYIVLNGKIIIVDKSTGRTMEGRRWSMGLHEAIEMKEGVSIGQSTRTKISITYPSFFEFYENFAGMTGTALTVQKELKSTYKKEVFSVPTFKPILRKDLPDAVYFNEQEKWLAVIRGIKEAFQKGQPILIGTTSIQKSEFLSSALKKENIPHKVLNAKPENIALESEIIAQAGKKYSITIATNMAGRGTDILLGGNLEFQVQQKIVQLVSLDNPNGTYSNFLYAIKKEYAKSIKKLILDIKNLPYSYTNSKQSLQRLYRHIYAENYLSWKQENKEVKKLGGLIVLGTERHESRRIDDQLRGRAGRQGDPGLSQFYLSLNDDLFQKYAGSSFSRLLDSLDLESDIPLASPLLTSTIEKVQQKVENFYFEGRKNLLEFEKPINTQRNLFFSARYRLITQQNWLEEFLHQKEKAFELSKNWQKLSNPFFPINLKPMKNPIFKGVKLKTLITTKYHFLGIFYQPYAHDYTQNVDIWIDTDLQQSKFMSYGHSLLPEDILTLIDNLWSNHSEQMQYDRENIQLKVYSQQNPTAQYMMNSFDAFNQLNSNILRTIFSYFEPLSNFEEFAMYGGLLYKRNPRYSLLWDNFEKVEKISLTDLNSMLLPQNYTQNYSYLEKFSSSQEILNLLF